MNLRKLCALYSIVVGLSIIAVWVAYFATGTVFGVHVSSDGLSYHIAAELLTAAVIIAAGAGLLSRAFWGLPAYFTGLGMLLYAVVNAYGYYVRDAKFMIVVFAVSGIFDIIFIIAGLFIKDESKT